MNWLKANPPPHESKTVPNVAHVSSHAPSRPLSIVLARAFLATLFFSFLIFYFLVFCLWVWLGCLCGYAVFGVCFFLLFVWGFCLWRWLFGFGGVNFLVWIICGVSWCEFLNFFILSFCCLIGLDGLFLGGWGGYRLSI